MEWKPFVIGLAAALIPWVVREIFQNFKEKGAGQAAALKANTEAICQLRTSLLLFEQQVEQLMAAIGPITKMQRDLDVAHAHLRIIAPHLYNPTHRGE